MKKKQGANCEYCVNYSYDDDYECYTCDMNLVEDEMYRFFCVYVSIAKFSHLFTFTYVKRF